MEHDDILTLAEACMEAYERGALCTTDSLDLSNCTLENLRAQVTSRCTEARILDAYRCVKRLPCDGFNAESVRACVPSFCSEESL